MNTSNTFNRIAVGTAQFGFSYGIANQSGQVVDQDAQAILLAAHRWGIDVLDTAITYGESESVLGRVASKNWKIITKLPHVPESCNDIEEWIFAEMRGSLARLRVDCIHGLLLHRPEQLLESRGKSIYLALCQLRRMGVVEKIGISIYDPKELDQLTTEMSFDIVQAPFNIFDRRLVTSGWMRRLQEMGTELHVRSVFLQGLLLMAPACRPKYFDQWNVLWRYWDNWLAETGLSPLQACLRFALSFPEINRLVIGVDSPNQLEQILAAIDGVLPPPSPQLHSDDLDLLNPSRWNIR